MLANVEAERGRLGLTKEQLAESLGITTTTYLKYIREENPSSRCLVNMSQLFGCSVDYLLGLSDSRARAG